MTVADLPTEPASPEADADLAAANGEIRAAGAGAGRDASGTAGAHGRQRWRQLPAHLAAAPRGRRRQAPRRAVQRPAEERDRRITTATSCTSRWTSRRARLPTPERPPRPGPPRSRARPGGSSPRAAARPNSPNGIFLDGQRRHLQPDDVLVKFDRRGDQLVAQVMGQFRAYETGHAGRAGAPSSAFAGSCRWRSKSGRRLSRTTRNASGTGARASRATFVFAMRVAATRASQPPIRGQTPTGSRRPSISATVGWAVERMRTSNSRSAGRGGARARRRPGTGRRGTPGGRR